MTADRGTRIQLDQAIHCFVSLFFLDPIFSESEQDTAEALGHTHLEYVSQQISECLLRDFRIDAHVDRSHTEQKLERRVYDVLFDRLIGSEFEADPSDSGKDILDILCEEMLQSLVTEHEIESRKK